MKKSNFQKGIESYKSFVENGNRNLEQVLNKVQRIESVKTPILQQPNFTQQASTQQMTNSGGVGNYFYTDFTTSEFYLLKELHKKNNWVRHACHIVATNVINTEPFFTLSTSKQSRNNSTLAKLQKVLSKPNRNETWYNLAYVTVYSMFLLGNAYWQIIRSRNGDIHSIYSVPADTIRPIPYIDKITGLLRFVYVQLTSSDGYNYNVQRVFTDEEIIHFRTPNPFSIVYGLSKFSPLFQQLSFDTNTKVYLNNYIENSFSGGMILQAKDSSPEVVERNREELVECLSGANNAGRNMILEGDISLIYDGNKTREFPLKEIYAKNAEEIMTTVGVPLSIANVRSDTSSLNVELISSEEQAFIRNIIKFYQNIIFNDIELKLFNNVLQIDDIYIESGTNTLFSYKNAENRVASALKLGLTVNEGRKMLGIPKLQDEEGDIVLIATNNGSIPQETFFESIEKDGVMKDIQLLQAQVNLLMSKQNQTSQTGENNVPSGETSETSIDDILSQIPSPSVGTGSGEVGLS